MRRELDEIMFEMYLTDMRSKIGRIKQNNFGYLVGKCDKFNRKRDTYIANNTEYLTLT